MRTRLRNCLQLLLAAAAALVVQSALAQVATRLVDANDGLYAHALVLAGNGGPPLQVQWVDRLSDIRETARYNAKLLAFGAIGGAAEGFSVIGTDSSARSQEPLEAFVLGREPMASPDGRFVSYLQFVPRQAQADVQHDVVLLYDLQRGRNAVGGVADDEGWVSRAANQGTTVYPGPPRSARVFPAAQGGGGGGDVKARGWSGAGDMHLVVAADGSGLLVRAVAAMPDGGYQVREGRISAERAFGPGANRSFAQVQVTKVSDDGADGAILQFDPRSGIAGNRLQLPLR